MTKANRICAAIAGNRPDRIPYALWTHFPEFDRDPIRLTQESWEFYQQLDVDFMKTMSNGMYPIEDMGCEIDFSEILHGGVAKVTSTPVKSIEDWDNVAVCDINKGALARELLSLQLLVEHRKAANEDIPIVFTCFSPMTIADKVSGKKVLEHLAQGGAEKVSAALARITKTTCALIKRAIQLGADGVFFGSQMSNYDLMEEDLYREFGKPYDVQVLNASAGWFNILHAHGDDIMFDLLKDYPVQAFNWHVGDSLPNMDECKLLTRKCLMGGLQRMDITNCRKNAVRDQIFRSIRVTEGKGLILTPGCVIRYPVDQKMLAFVHKTKEEIEDAIFRKDTNTN